MQNPEEVLKQKKRAYGQLEKVYLETSKEVSELNPSLPSYWKELDSLSFRLLTIMVSQRLLTKRIGILERYMDHSISVEQAQEESQALDLISRILAEK